MSSHHFVRAEQADCLIVVNRNIDEHLFAQLLEWNPVIVATSATLEWLVSQDIKVDIVLSNSNNIELPYPVQNVAITDIIEAIEYFESTLKVAGITIVGDGNVNFYLDYMLKKGNKNIALTETNAKYFLILEGEEFTKRMFENEIWYFYPEKLFQTYSNNIAFFENGFKVLKDETLVFKAFGNIIFKECV